MQVTSVGQQGTSLETVYTVPENVCVSEGTFGGGGKAFLPCGVTLALFDEVCYRAGIANALDISYV